MKNKPTLATALDTQARLSIMMEEYRALYGLVPLRLQSLERRVPVAGATLAAFLGSITVLPVGAQIVFLIGVPLVLVWFLRTTMFHARSFEDLIRRIEAIETRANELAGDELLTFQSSHPSRGRADRGRTGDDTVASVLVGVAVMLGSCLYLAHRVAPGQPAFDILYPLYIALIAGSLFVLALSQRRYRYSPSRRDRSSDAGR